MIRLTVPGQPVAKGRPRAGTVNGKVRMFTPAKTVNYEGLIALAGQQAMDGAPLIDGPLRLSVTATFAIPASWSKKRVAGALWHTGRPDGDNLLKAVGDGLNGVVWKDDSQIAVAEIRKLYGPTPGLLVEVLPL